MRHQKRQNVGERLEEDRQDTPNVGNSSQDENDDTGAPSFENVLEYLGVPGKFQMIQIVLAHMALFVCSFMVLSLVFEGYVPYHRCKKFNETKLISQYLMNMNGNSTTTSARVSYHQCDVRVMISFNQSIPPKDEKEESKTIIHSLNCPNGRDFFDAKDTTYVSEWDLVCESKGMAEFTQTVFAIGQIIGGLSASPITDFFGRKPVVVASTSLSSVVQIAHVFSPTIYIIYIVKFFGGLFYQAALTSVIIFCVELMVPRHRHTFIIISMTVWDITLLTMGGVAYFVQDQTWRYIHVASLAFSPVCLLTPFVLKESTRWLVANGRFKKALDIIERACNVNGKDFEIAKEKFNAFVSYKYSHGHHCDQNLVPPVIGYDTQSKPVTTESENGSSSPEISSTHPTSATKNSKKEERTEHASSPMDLLRKKWLLILVVAGSYLWFTNDFIYYGLYMYSSDLAGNRFLNYSLMCLVEIPSFLLAHRMMSKIGRRIVLCIFIGLTGSFLTTSVLITVFGEGLPGSGTAITVLAILTLSMATSSRAVLYVRTPELFPTNMRTTAYGCCGAMGRISLMVAPYMSLFHSLVPYGPPLMLAVLCCLTLVVSLVLPETKDKDLPSTLEDAMIQEKGVVVNKHSGKKRIEYEILED